MDDLWNRPGTSRVSLKGRGSVSRWAEASWRASGCGVGGKESWMQVGESCREDGSVRVRSEGKWVERGWKESFTEEVGRVPETIESFS